MRPTSHSSRLTSYKGRFAPSPTGPLHFGSLIAAVGSYLEAKSRGGDWLVRIEDLDPPREQPGADYAILRTLERFGFTWDGPVTRQSRRHRAYHLATEKLIASGDAYPCACSRREVRKWGVQGVEGPVYPGTCRQGIFRDKARSLRSLRVRVTDVPIEFADALQGDTVQNLARDIGDFIIRRADNFWSYQLAVVVDDAAHGITHVVRGADLALSTPRQIYLQRLLELPTPQYMHLPLATTTQGEKLSKQTHAPPVEADRANRWLVRALDFLGQQPPGRLTQADLNTIWQWAMENWDSGKLTSTKQDPTTDERG